MHHRTQLTQVLCAILVLLAAIAVAHANNTPRIAVIGSGITGASFAHYLNTVFDGVRVDVFERSERVGGRLHTVEAYGQRFELGGTFVVSENALVRELADTYGVALKESLADGQRLGIVRQNRLQWATKPDAKVRNLASLLWRYGFPLVKFVWHEKHKLKQFLSVYDSSLDFARPKPFYNLTDFLVRTDTLSNFNQTTEEYFRDEAGVEGDVVTELLQGAISDFYNQNIDINGVAGLVSGAGFLGDAWVMREGANELPRRILATLQERTHARIVTHTQTTVTKVTSVAQRVLESGDTRTRYEVQYESARDGAQTATYDVVVIAAPLEIANITFAGDLTLPVQNSKAMRRKGKPIEKYFVAAEQVRPAALKDEDLREVDMIMSPDRILGKVSFMRRVCANCYARGDANVSLYTMTANQTLTREQFDRLFTAPEVLRHYPVKWPYPDLADSRGKPLPEIIIAPGVYYPNAMEFIASCMEMEAISAKNVVNLIAENEGRDWPRASAVKSDL